MKPAWQVEQSAAAMDAALAGGLSREQLVTLTAARAARQQGSEPYVDPVELHEALRHPAARLFDETFVRRERHQQAPN